MGNPIARIGDPIDHGGVVITGSGNWTCNGIPIARANVDLVNCAIHGINPIITGSPNWKCNGYPIARVTSVTACGAVIISGSPNWQVT